MCRAPANEVREGIYSGGCPHANSGGRFWVIKCCCNRAITLLITDRLWQSLPQGPQSPLNSIRHCFLPGNRPRSLPLMTDPSPIQSPGPLTVALRLEAGQRRPPRPSFFQPGYKQITDQAQMNTLAHSGEDLDGWQLTAANFTGKIPRLVGFKQDCDKAQMNNGRWMQSKRTAKD